MTKQMTNEERDRETARRILESRVPFPGDAVINDVAKALSTVNSEGEAKAAVLRGALKNVHDILYPLIVEKRSAYYEACELIQKALSSTTVGADLLKRLEDAERKARAFDWLASHPTSSEPMAFWHPVKHCWNWRCMGLGFSTLLEAIESAAKEPK